MSPVIDLLALFEHQAISREICLGIADGGSGHLFSIDLYAALFHQTACLLLGGGQLALHHQVCLLYTSGAGDPADAGDLITYDQRIAQIFRILLPLVLRTNHEEVEHGEHKDEYEMCIRDSHYISL